MADAGYGKSTFVHEMARRWVNGEEMWTQKFSFVFLFRLSEVSQNETHSIRTLLTMCFNANDSLTVSQWLAHAEHMEKCLFIFDGLDELQQEFCEEVDHLIFGKGVKHAHVVVTSRPSKRLEEKIEDVFCNNLYIQLNGYTEDGVNRQLEKFKIKPKHVGNDFRDILKVPLFNTLYCITHKEATICCLSVCTAIEKFVKFASKRYRKTANFTNIEEDELLMMLGQGAQNKFSLMKGVNIGYPHVTSHHLSTAFSIGLVSKKSTQADFVFAHQTIAEYCAAYFWIKKSRLKVKNIKEKRIDFSKPKGGSLDYTELFSCFLSHLNVEYKKNLWKNFEEYAPLLDEYESVPTRLLKENRLRLDFVPISYRNLVMDKIEFSTSTSEDVVIYCANFKSEKKFENITKMKHLCLYDCPFNISPEEFFRSYSIKYLYLHKCTFNDWNPVKGSLKEIWKNGLVLEYMHLFDCDYTVTKFLSCVMRHCTTLKTLKLSRLFESRIRGVDYFGDGWISKLQNNDELLHSIRYFRLYSSDPTDLTVLFETFAKMIHLKKLELTVKRNLKQAEINSLKISFENELKELEELEVDLKDENGRIEASSFEGPDRIRLSQRRHTVP